MDKEKIILTTRQILLYLVDAAVILHQPFDYHGMYRKSIEDYFDWRYLDKKRFRDCLCRLKQEGFIKIYLQNNKHIIELNAKGKRRVGLILVQNYRYQYPQVWDGKWRIVIFDIPEKKKKNREILRAKIKEIGFLQLQESVFIFPFDCKEIIDSLKDLLMIRANVQYIIAEAVETQVDLIKVFLNRGVLKHKMIKRKR